MLLLITGTCRVSCKLEAWRCQPMVTIEEVIGLLRAAVNGQAFQQEVCDALRLLRALQQRQPWSVMGQWTEVLTAARVPPSLS